MKRLFISVNTKRVQYRRSPQIWKYSSFGLSYQLVITMKTMQLLVSGKQRFVFMKSYIQCINCGGKQWQNTSFFGKMPLLINCNIFQLCIDFSQLPNEHTAFILWRLTVSPVFSRSFQLSTVFLLMDWFSWVKLKNSEHLITLWPAHFLRGKEERGEKSPSRLVPVKSKLSRDLFFLLASD